MSSGRALKLLAALVALLAVVYASTSIYVANSALSAELKPLTERPSDIGLVYEDVEFSPRGWPELRLRGWWLPAADSRGTVIRVHGIDGNRSSLLGLSGALTRAGFSVLVFDLRGHGQSDAAQMGAGLHERDDVLGAVDYVIQQRGIRPGAVLLHGNSYGAAISLMAGWRDDRVAGVFADSAFASLSDLVAQEVARRTALPRWAASALRPGIVLAGRVIEGININDVQPMVDAAMYDYPLGLAHCRPDDRIPLTHFERIRSAVQVQPRSRVFEDCGHSDAWPDHAAEYESMVIAYVVERLG